MPVRYWHFYYMVCLVVAATSFEISPFLDYYRNNNDHLSRRQDIDVMITGIGLAATTYSLTKQLQIRRPDIVIQAGIGGCFPNNFSLGTVVAIKQETIADLGVTEKKQVRSVFDLGLASPDQFPFTKGWLVNQSDILKTLRLKKVRAITINEITTSQNRIKHYREQFDPVAESMEGAALHYVCLMEKIPFLQLRSLSNYVGERNKKKWELKCSITNLNNELLKIINLLNP